MLDMDKIKQKALGNAALTRQECLEVLDFPDDRVLAVLDAAFEVRREHFGRKVFVQVLLNAKSGLCTEDCGYCTQSSVSKAEISEYPLRPGQELLDGAVRARKTGATRYCMALSGIKYGDSLIASLAASISRIKKEAPIELCCSIGFLSPAQAETLKQAGLDRVNHNLNTGRKYYPQVCSTHTYDERVKNIETCRAAGLEICSGGIVGLGEGREDLVDMLMDLKGLKPDSIPLNFFIPAEGARFADRGGELTPQYCLKALCLARFLNPACDIRAAGGREYRLKSMQGMALYPASSIFVSGYLTTGGQPAGEGLEMIRDMGFEAVIEGVE